MATENNYVNREASDKLYDVLGSKVGSFSKDGFYNALLDDNRFNDIVSSLKVSDKTRQAVIDKLRAPSEIEAQTDKAVNGILDNLHGNNSQAPTQRSNDVVNGQLSPKGNKVEIQSELPEIKPYEPINGNRTLFTNNGFTQMKQNAGGGFGVINPYVGTESEVRKSSIKPDWMSDEEYANIESLYGDDTEFKSAIKSLDDAHKNWGEINKVPLREEVEQKIRSVQKEIEDTGTLSYNQMGSSVTGFVQYGNVKRKKELNDKLAMYQNQLRLIDQINNIRTIGKDDTKWQQFKKGAVYERNAEDWITFGLNQIKYDKNTKALYDKALNGEKLSNDELQTMMLVSNLTELKQNAPEAYTWGGRFTNTAAFCADMALTTILTGGTGGALSAANKLFKVGTAGARKMALRRMGAAAVYNMAVMPINPMLYRELSNETLSQYQFGGVGYDNGQFKPILKKNQKTNAEIAYRAMAKTFSESYTESLGAIFLPEGFALKLLNKSKLGVKAADYLRQSMPNLNIFLSKMGRGWDKFNKYARISSIPGEIGEEVFNVPFQSLLLWEDQFHDNEGNFILADPKFYLEIALDTALLGGIGGAVGGARASASTVANRVKINKDFRKLGTMLNSYNTSTPVSVEQLKAQSESLGRTIDALKKRGATPEEIYGFQSRKAALDNMIAGMESAGESYIPVNDDVVAGMDNVRNTILGGRMDKDRARAAYAELEKIPANPGTYEFLGVADAYIQTALQREGLIAGLTCEMETDLGKMAYKNDDYQTVVTVTLDDGSQWYMLESDEDAFAVTLRSVENPSEKKEVHPDDIRTRKVERVEDKITEWLATSRVTVNGGGMVEAVEGVTSAPYEAGADTSELDGGETGNDGNVDFAPGDRVSYGGTTYIVDSVGDGTLVVKTENGEVVSIPLDSEEVTKLSDEENAVIDQAEGKKPLEVGQKVRIKDDEDEYIIQSIDGTGNVTVRSAEGGAIMSISEDDIVTDESAPVENPVGPKEPVAPEGDGGAAVVPETSKPQFESGKVSERISKKWEDAPKQYGFEDRQYVGKKPYNVRYVLTEQGAVTPSHDWHTFKPIDDFIKTATGENANSRAYEQPSKRAAVESRAKGYNGKAFQDPVFVKDGAVISGNGRTMSGYLAMEAGTDKQYIDDLKYSARKFGFTSEQVEQFRNPRVYADIIDDIELNSDLFDAFNKPTTEGESMIDRAIAFSKKKDNPVIDKLIFEVSKYATLSELYNNPTSSKVIKDMLINSGFLNENQVPTYFSASDGKFTAEGKALLESVLNGCVLDTKHIMLLNSDGMGNVRTRIARCAPIIMKNVSLGKELSLERYINNAIEYVNSARPNGVNIFGLVATMRDNNNNIFDDVVYDDMSTIIAIKLLDSDESFKEFLNSYNKFAAENSGIDSMFGDEFNPMDKYDEAVRKIQEELNNLGNTEKDGKRRKELEAQLAAIAESKISQRGNTDETGGGNIQSGTETSAGTDNTGEEKPAEQPEVKEESDTVEAWDADYRDNYPEPENATDEDKSWLELKVDRIARYGGVTPIVNGVREIYSNGDFKASSAEIDRIRSLVNAFGKSANTTDGDMQIGYYDVRQKTFYGIIAIHPKYAGEGWKLRARIETLKEPQPEVAESEPQQEQTETEPANEPAQETTEQPAGETPTETAEPESEESAEQVTKTEEDTDEEGENGIKQQQTNETINNETESETTENNPEETLTIAPESKDNELTEDDIRNSGYPDNDVIDSAIDFIRGDDTSFAAQIAYKNIKEYVRSKSDDSKQNSGNENTAQLASSNNEASSGENKPSGNEVGQVDTDAVSGRGRVPSDKKSSSKSSGKQGNKRVQGNISDGVSEPSGDIQPGGPDNSGGRGNELDDRRRNKTEGSQNSQQDNAARVEAGSTDVSSLEDELTSLINGFGSHPLIGNDPVIAQEDNHSSFIRRKFSSLAKKLFSFDNANTKPERDDVLSRKRPRIIPVSLSTEGLSQNDIILVGKIIFGAAKTGYAVAKTTSLFGKRDFSRYFISKFGNLIKDKMGYDDAHLMALVDEAWHTKLKINGERLPLVQHIENMRDSEIREWFTKTRQERAELQKERNNSVGKNRYADRNEIKNELPILQPGQWDDVVFAERQFFDPSHNDYDHAFGKGALVTNGTGTGKTFTGLGVIKRFVKEGKKNILIVCPANMKPDWLKTSKFFGIDIDELDNKKDAGSGVSITSYENFRDNNEIMGRVFDLVVYDECQNILTNQQGGETLAYGAHIMVTNKDIDSATERMLSATPDGKRRFELSKEKEELRRKLSKAKGGDVFDLSTRMDSVDKEMNDVTRKLELLKPSLKEKAKDAVDTTKVLMLSATPFNTVKNLVIAEGMIFNYPKVIRSDGSENTKSDAKYGNFITEWFSSESKSDDEIDFGDHLLDELETMCFRELENGFDYSRDFPDVSGKVKAVMFNQAWRFIMGSPLREYASFLSNPIWTTQLFEVMKVSAIKDRIREHLDLGRKIILFHDRLHETRVNIDANGKVIPPVGPPFTTVLQMAKMDTSATSDVTMAAQTFISQFGGILKWEQTLDYRPVPEQINDMFATAADREKYAKEMEEYNRKVAEYQNKLSELQRKFPNYSIQELYDNKLIQKAPKHPKLKAESVCLFNGECTPKEKEEAKEQFNSDTGNKRIICVNTKSGGAGLSLHDTTGKFQRVMIGLALPVSPIGFIQCEGRPFRFGNMSNGIFEYPLLGIDLEAIIFAQSFNVKAETVENLSHGTRGRGLKASIMTQFYENGGNVPLAGQGVGSKEMDRRGNALKGIAKAIHDFGVAIKKTIVSSDKSVPEPVGYVMSKLAGTMPGDLVMVPYAGRGSASRYFDSNINVESYANNQETLATLTIVASGENMRISDTPFDNVGEVKKGDVVIIGSVLNGKLATDSIAKGFRHTSPGGRIIAALPEDIELDKTVAMLGKEALVRTVITVGKDILGSGIPKSNIIVIDRVANPKMREGKNINRIDLTMIASQDELFQEIDKIVAPERIIDKEAIKLKKVKSVISELKNNDLVSDVTFNNKGIRVSYKTNKGFKVQRVKFSSLTLSSVYSYYQGTNEYIDLYNFNYASEDADWIRVYTRAKEYLEMDADELRENLRMDKGVKEEKVQALRDLLKIWIKLAKAASGYNDSQINRIKNGLKPEIDLADITDMVTLDVLKEKFDTANDDEELQDIFDRAFSVAVKGGVRLDDSPASPGAAAEYDPNGHVLRFDKLAWNRANDRRKTEVLLHELIHSVTSYALEYYRYAVDVPEKLENAVDWVDRIYRAIQDGAPEHVRLLSGTLSYALENTHEFLANITNPDIENSLKKRPMWIFVSGDKRRVSGKEIEGWNKVTAWELIKDALIDIINNYDGNLIERYKSVSLRSVLHPEIQESIDNEIQANISSSNQSLSDTDLNRATTEAVTTLLSEAGVNVEMVSEEEANNASEGQFRISSEIEKEYPNWMDNQVVTEGKKGQQTQVAGTVGTYKKVGNWIKENLPANTTVLDASSGMGLGTIALNEMGLQTEDVEPYPSSERMKLNAPTYTSYNDVNKKYDYIISNAVLNVIPDDWRKDILLSMASKMKDGGRMFINTRKAGEEKGIKNKIELDTPQEVLVGTKEKITSYQKFFTPSELKEYVQGVLGDGYSVEIANEKNSGTSGLAAVVVTKIPQIYTEQFKNWFGDWENNPKEASKVIDKNGHPLVVYHGTNKEFNVFESGKTGVRYVMGLPYNVTSQGFFFTADESDASGYANQRNKGNGSANIMPVYLNLRNPADLSKLTYESESLFRDITGMWPIQYDEAEHNIESWWKIADRNGDKYDIDLVGRLNELGYDGIIFAEKNGEKSYFVTNPNQIKSATNNNGDFNPNNPDIRFRTSSGIVYGYAKNGKIYLNAERLNPNTPIHEYTHLWDNACQQLNPELWRRGKELMKQTSVWQEVINDDNYASIRNDEDAVASEVHSRLTGRSGAELLEKLANEGNTATEKITARGLIGRLRKWLNSFWKWTKDTFTNWTKEEADKVSLEDFVNMPIGSLVRGENPTGPDNGGKPTDTEPMFDIRNEEETQRKIKTFLNSNSIKPRKRLREQLIDRFTPIAEFMKEGARRGASYGEMEDAYVAAGAIANRSQGQILYYQKNILNPLQKAIVGLEKAFKDSGLSKDWDEAYNDVVEFLYALHAPERNRHITLGEIYKAVVKNTSDRTKELLQSDKVDDVLMDICEVIYGNVFEFGSTPINVDRYGLENTTEVVGALRAAIKSANSMAVKIAKSEEGNNRSGMTDEEAREIVEKFNKPEFAEQIEELRRRRDAASKFVRDMWLEYEVIDDNAYRELSEMYKEYIPLRGWDETEDIDWEAVPNMIYKGSEMVSLNRHAKGRTSRSDNPFAYLDQMAISAIIRGNRNRARVRLFNYISKNAKIISDIAKIPQTYIVEDADGTQEVWFRKPNDAEEEMGYHIVGRGYDNRFKWHTTGAHITEKVVPVNIDGNTYFMEFEGDFGLRTAKAIKEENASRIEWNVWKGANRFVGFMKSAMTSANPKFWIKNFRDIPYAAFIYHLNHGMGSSLKYDMLLLTCLAKVAGIKSGLIKDNSETGRMFREFEENGGATGWTRMKDINTIKNDLNWIRARYGEGGVLKVTAANVGNFMKHLAESLSSLSEITPRFAAYVAGREHGMSPEYAAKQAREITVDFSQKGTQSSFWDTLYVFFTPTINAADRTISEILKHPVKAGMDLALFTALSYVLAVMAAGDDDDDDGKDNPYDNISDYNKFTNWLIKDKDHFISIPKPQNIRGIMNLAEQTLNVQRGRKSFEQAMLDWSRNIIADFSPLDWDAIDLSEGGAGNVTRSLEKFLMPTVARPITELINNEDFMGHPIYRENSIVHQPTVPQWKFAGRKTPEAYVNTARWLNTFAGGTDYRSARFVNDNGEISQSTVRGLFDINPSWPAHIIEGYLGGFADIAHEAVSPWRDENNEVNYNNIPVLNVLLKEPFIKKSYTKYFNIRDEVEIIKSDISESMKAGNYPEAIITKKINARKVMTYDAYEKILRKLRSNLADATTPQQVELIQTSIDRTIDRMVNAYYKAEDADETKIESTLREWYEKIK